MDLSVKLSYSSNNMETFTNLISHPFSWGLIIGLVLLVLSWKSSLTHKKYLKSEIKRLTSEGSELQTHLSTQLKINAKGHESLQPQLDAVTKQNATLRVNIQNLQQKPEKAEHRRLEVMEMAVTSMREPAPGFAQAWEKSLREAEDSMAAAESGFTKLIRKVVPTFRSTPAAAKNDTKMIEAEVSNGSD